MRKATTDEALIKALKEVKAAKPLDLSVILCADHDDVRNRLQRLRRNGIVQVAQRIRIASTTYCTYSLAQPKETEERFNGYLSYEATKALRQSLIGTPWQQMGCLV